MAVNGRSTFGVVDVLRGAEARQITWRRADSRSPRVPPADMNRVTLMPILVVELVRLGKRNVDSLEHSFDSLEDSNLGRVLVCLITGSRLARTVVSKFILLSEVRCGCKYAKAAGCQQAWMMRSSGRSRVSVRATHLFSWSGSVICWGHERNGSECVCAPPAEPGRGSGIGSRV